MKKFKTICSAIAALTVLALAGCDLNVPDGDKVEYPVPEEDSVEKLPYTKDTVSIGTTLSPLSGTKTSDGSAWTIDKGLSFSFALSGLDSDWTQIFHTNSGNFGLTCMHYCEKGAWKANVWPTNNVDDKENGYPSENSPAKTYNVYLGTDCYVTISLTKQDITFYKDGEKMFHYADDGKTKVGYNADSAFPGMESWCTGVLTDLLNSGCEYRSKDTWTSSIKYNMTNFEIDIAVDADGAKAKYDVYAKKQ